MRIGDDWPLAVPFALISVLALGFGLFLLRRQVGLWRRGLVFDARVVERKLHAGMPHPGRRTVATVTPYFAYRTRDGEERVARLDHQAIQRQRHQGWRLRYPLGAQLQVRIDPRRPEIAYDASLRGQFVFPVLLVGAGILTGLISLGIAFG